MSSAQAPETASTTPEPGTSLARHSVGMAGVLFQSVTFMAPGAAVATSLAVAPSTPAARCRSRCS
jgi:hypothetical protein